MKYLAVLFFLLSLVGCSNNIATPSSFSSLAEQTLIPTSKIDKVIATPYLPRNDPRYITSTPIPTMLPEIQTKVAGVLEVGGSCKLPCWWQITPRQTKCSEAMRILQAYSSSLADTCDKNWINALFLSSEKLGILLNIRITNNVAEAILVDGELGKYYDLSSILQSLGQPTDIWLSTVDPERAPGIKMTLFYPNKGIMAVYSANANVTKDTIQACFTSSPTLTLWSPSSVFDVLGAMSLFAPPDYYPSMAHMKTSENALGIGQASFYEKFSHSNQPPCLETPRNLWKE